MEKTSEFVLLFRQENVANSNIAPDQIKIAEKKWENWIGSIAAQGNLANMGNRLAKEGQVLKPAGVITDGPFVEGREMLGGFIVIKAESMEEAVTLAHGCPAMEYKGSVEIRPVQAMTMPQ